MELSKGSSRLLVMWTALLLVLIILFHIGGCATEGLPFTVGRTWFDQNWELQQPMVQIGGVDSGGWRHFVVTAGVVTGSGATSSVSDVWTAGDVLYMSLDYDEPVPSQGARRRVARLEVEIPQADLPDPVSQVVLVTGGKNINIAVSRAQAVELVRAEVETTAVGLGPDIIDGLAPSVVLLVREREDAHVKWQWIVELMAPGAQPGDMRVHATVDATTGAVVDLVID